MATTSAFEKYAYRIFADLYEQGWGETAAWNKAYEKAGQKFNNTSNI